MVAGLGYLAPTMPRVCCNVVIPQAGESRDEEPRSDPSPTRHMFVNGTL